MDDVEAHVARPRAAHDGVEVRPVVVERRAHPVHELRDLLDVRVEDPERVRVGEHQAGDVLVEVGLQVVHVDAALVVRADLDDLVAGHRHRRRVGPVRGVGREDLVRRAAVGVVEGAREQHAGQLAVRAGAGLQRDVREARDLGQRALELVHQLQRALGARGLLRGVQPGVAGQRRDPLVQLRVVLHRARAERVEARVEVEVALGDPVEVPVDLRLGDLRQARRLGAAEALGERVRVLRHVQRRRHERAPAVLGLLEDRPRAVALLRGLGDAHACTAWRSAATAAPSTSARRSMSSRVRCSVMAISRPSSYSG